MSAPSFEVPSQCKGCNTAGLCKSALDDLAQELAPDVERAEKILAEYDSTGELGVDPGYFQRLGQVVETGTRLLALETAHTGEFMSQCPGRRKDGACGLSPQAQIDMMPTLVDPDNLHYQEVVRAAGQIAQQGWDPRLN
jgi:hypothetical protein